MSIFRKLSSLLFEENEEDTGLEDELVDIGINRKHNTQERSFTFEEKEERKEPEHETMEFVKEEPQEEKKFVSIEISEEKPKEIVIPNVRQSERSTMPKTEKKEYEFSPVISPIFGSKEEDKGLARKTISVGASKPKKQNPLGTVISPYYGIHELEEFEAEAKEEIEKNEKSKYEFVAEEDNVILDSEEDIDSIPLEDLLSDKEEDEEDVIQISLFGESASLKEQKEENIIKE